MINAAGISAENAYPIMHGAERKNQGALPGFDLRWVQSAV
jgi:hypothetical protein